MMAVYKIMYASEQGHVTELEGLLSKVKNPADVRSDWLWGTRLSYTTLAAMAGWM